MTSECTCCGKEFPRLNQTIVEGAVVEVCERCSKFGTKINAPHESDYKAIKKSIKLSDLENLNVQLVPEYGRLILTVRESKGLSRYDFATKINEKESVIKRLEDQEFEPDESLIKKIEGFLDIKLTERYETDTLHQREKKRPELTVGDVIEVS